MGMNDEGIGGRWFVCECGKRAATFPDGEPKLGYEPGSVFHETPACALFKALEPFDFAALHVNAPRIERGEGWRSWFAERGGDE